MRMRGVYLSSKGFKRNILILEHFNWWRNEHKTRYFTAVITNPTKNCNFYFINTYFLTEEKMYNK